MPISGNYRVETVSQTALVLGTDSWLQKELVSTLRSLDIEVYLGSAELPPGIELDYLLILGVSDLPVASALEKLSLSRSCQRLVVAHRLESVPSLPRAFRVTKYVDTFGPNFSLAPTFTAMLEQGLGQGRLILPGDGLQDYPLLTDRDLVTGVTKSLTHGAQSSPPFLASGSISLLSLAYLIRSSSPKSIELSFDNSASWDDDQPDPWQISQTYAAIDWRPSSDLQTSLLDYIKVFSPQITPIPNSQLPSSTAPSFSPSHPPRLSRLADINLSPINHQPSTINHLSSPRPQPAFVPLPAPKRPRPKLKKLSAYLPTRPRLRIPRPLAVIAGGMVFGVGLYLFALTMSLTLTFLTLRGFRQDVSQSILPSLSSVKTARYPAVFLEANLVAVSAVPYLGNSQPVQDLTLLASSYRHSLDVLILAHNLSETSSELILYVMGEHDGDLAGLISLARLQSGELYEELSLLQGSLPSSAPAILPSGLHASYRDLLKSLNTLRKHALTAKTLLAISPELLGAGDRRKYLILFQNNMELRATGGFIGSFAILSFENGQLYDFPIYDVYSADGQLKGHVEPPPEIKDYLGEANWYLRDSNWDPDFPTSARRAEWFLDKTLGTSVDGTIAINVNTLASILEALGPIKLPDYEESVSADNIFERAEYHSEVNFFPGSSQKKEFLSSVAEALYTKLTSLDAGQAFPVARGLLTSIDEKNLLLAIDSDTANHTLATLGWNGQLRTPSCPDLSDNCYLDYAMLVDSNFGVNKANYFLRRSLALDVTIDKDRRLDHRLQVTYQNTSTSAAWPAGPYKNYSRLYIPKGAILDSVSVDGVLVPEDKISFSADHNRSVIGFLVEVPINSTVVVEVRYRLSSRLAETSPVYSLYWQKQPGTSADPLNITLNFPLYLDPAIVSPEASVGEQQLEFNLSNITDRRISVQFK